MITFLPHMFVKYSNDLCDRTKFRRFRYANAYVENDILYSFHLKRWSDRKYTVEFGVRPLCMGLHYVDTGVFEIGMLIKDLHFGTLEIDELWQYVTSEIIPFFDSCKTPKAALQSVQEMYYRINALRLDGLRREGIADGADPVEKRLYLDDNVLYLAMKSLDYESMIKSLSYKIPLSESKVDLFAAGHKKYISKGDTKMADVYEKKMKSESEDCIYLKTLLDHAVKQDSEYFVHVMEIRENDSKKRLPAKLFF